MEEQLYKKKGKRYVKVGYSDNFNGFPADGIWVVYSSPGSHSSTCIGQVGELKPLNYELLAQLVSKKETECLQAVMSLREKGKWSYYDMVKTVFETLCKHEKTT